jgi:hypothetical protein
MCSNRINSAAGKSQTRTALPAGILGLFAVTVENPGDRGQWVS